MDPQGRSFPLVSCLLLAQPLTRMSVVCCCVGVLSVCDIGTASHVTMKIEVFWGLMPCHLVDSLRTFRRSLFPPSSWSSNPKLLTLTIFHCSLFFRQCVEVWRSVHGSFNTINVLCCTLMYLEATWRLLSFDPLCCLIKSHAGQAVILRQLGNLPQASVGKSQTLDQL
jgi:hypothetical protein